MAQLGNTVVNGSLRVIGDFYANGYIDTTVTLTSSGWSGTDLFTQKVNVAGVKADNNYRVYQYISSGATAAEIKTYLKNFSYVVSGYATPADGSITFTTIKKPTANVTVRIVGDSNVERTTVQNTEVTSMKSDIASINTSLNTLNTSLAKKANTSDLYAETHFFALESGYMDLNNYTKSGIYNICDAATNLPPEATGWGLLVVYGLETGTPFQLWMWDSDTHLYKRNFTSSSFGSWVKLF